MSSGSSGGTRRKIVGFQLMTQKIHIPGGTADAPECFTPADCGSGGMCGSGSGEDGSGGGSGDTWGPPPSGPSGPDVPVSCCPSGVPRTLNVTLSGGTLDLAHLQGSTELVYDGVQYWNSGSHPLVICGNNVYLQLYGSDSGPPGGHCFCVQLRGVTHDDYTDPGQWCADPTSCSPFSLTITISISNPLHCQGTVTLTITE